MTNELVDQSQSSFKDRRHKSDIRHSGRVIQQQEFLSRSAAVALDDKANFKKSKAKTANCGDDASSKETEGETNVAKRKKTY